VPVAARLGVVVHAAEDDFVASDVVGEPDGSAAREAEVGDDARPDIGDVLVVGDERNAVTLQDWRNLAVLEHHIVERQQQCVLIHADEEAGRLQPGPDKSQVRQKSGAATQDDCASP